MNRQSYCGRNNNLKDINNTDDDTVITDCENKNSVRVRFVRHCVEQLKKFDEFNLQCLSY